MTCKTIRPSKAEVYLRIAQVAALRASCMRRAVGAVITDDKDLIRAVAYNGTPQSLPNCTDGHFCEGLNLAPGKDKCLGQHAEQNAVLIAKNDPMLRSIYVTEAPCFICAKFLLSTNIQNIIILQDGQPDSKALWLKANRNWIVYEPPAQAAETSEQVLKRHLAKQVSRLVASTPDFSMKRLQEFVYQSALDEAIKITGSKKLACQLLDS